MSKEERRREKQREWEAEQEMAERERRRVDALSMHDRIEEFVGDEQLRVILHKIADQCGLEN